MRVSQNISGIREFGCPPQASVALASLRPGVTFAALRERKVPRKERKDYAELRA